MGYNTVVVLYNDHFHNIKNDPKFGERLVRAAQEADRDYNVKRDGNVSWCNRGLGEGMVYPSFHASDYQVFAAGGNSLVNLGSIWGSKIPLNDEEAVKALKTLADQYGYSLRKKPNKGR